MLATILLTFAAQAPEPAPGVSLDLARSRAAAIADLRYRLNFRLDHAAASSEGEVAVTFTLAAPWPEGEPLVIDFGGDGVAQASINNAAVELVRVADHLLVPAPLLRVGPNELRCRFSSKVAPSGTPLTVYRDPDGKGEYYYTLLVPADAHRLFPCFDQPDLKARFELTLDLPEDWRAVANGAVQQPAAAPADGRREWSFAPTAPLPTYLFAFACGSFAVAAVNLREVPGLACDRMQIFMRPNQQAIVDTVRLQRLHDEGLGWLQQFFGVDYPFGKLDIVLLPGFPYGGMEHAGAIFYRETALAFDHPPTDGELVRRSTLVYHELSHQWFGNLVTMKWFDDLWLKEGFATFAAYRAMERLEPERQSWLRFLQRVKPRAYEVDTTPGTTPVYQSLQNLADAKSAYGPIVYNKAPAVLRELEDRIGSARFRSGLERFLTVYRFGNATWQDLAKCLEDAAEVDLDRWSQRWLLSKSLPQVRVQWSVDEAGTVTGATLEQTPVGGGGTWPLRVDLLIVSADGNSRRLLLESDRFTMSIDDLIGARGVACIVANPGDVAYAQFLPDARSRVWMADNAGTITDPLLRAVMIGSLFESVREAEFAPADHAEMILRVAATELDADSHAWLLDQLARCLESYLDAAVAEELRNRAAALLHRQLEGASDDRRQLPIFRFLAQHASDDRTRDLCLAAVEKGALPTGVPLGLEDRFLGLAALLATAGWLAPGEGEPLAEKLLADNAAADCGRHHFLARAAERTAAAKASYFERYRADGAAPEQWLQDSLPFFHWRGQHELTRPYLRPALELAPWVKSNRRIFFMPAWLEAFVNGHSDAGSLAVVDAFLAEAHLDGDVRQKLEQARDGLARAVRIRERFPLGR